MSDTEKSAEGPSAEKPMPPKRSPGHRGADVRDTVAEMAAKAHEISLEAGSKMAAAMKDVIGAAAGLSAFSIESARDLVQFMVRRSQMTQEEADKLILEAEAAWLKKNKGKALPTKPEPFTVKAAPAAKPAPAKPAAKPAAKPVAKPAPAAKAPAKAAPAKKAAPAAKKAAPAAKKPAPKK